MLRARESVFGQNIQMRGNMSLGRISKYMGIYLWAEYPNTWESAFGQNIQIHGNLLSARVARISIKGMCKLLTTGGQTGGPLVHKQWGGGWYSGTELGNLAQSGPQPVP